MSKRVTKFFVGRDLQSVILLSFAFLICALLPVSLRSQSSPVRPDLSPGQSTTQLPDGRWLVVGGEGFEALASIWNPQTGVITPLATGPNTPRSWHSTTMLPDGSVFIFGGIGTDGQVLTAPELFDPVTQSFELLPIASSLSPSARSHHTATLLTDGRILIAGGIGSDGQVLDFAELLDIPQSAIRIPQSVARHSHSASLLPDGTVLLSGGQDETGSSLDGGDLFDPSSDTFVSVSSSEIENLKSQIENPELVVSLPVDGAVDVAVDSVIALRFSKPLRVETVNSDTVTLNGPTGVEQIKVIPAEGGMLAFITPEEPLLPGAEYTITVNGPTDRDGLLLPLSGITFTTEGSASSNLSSGESASSSSLSSSESEIENPKSKIGGADLEDGWEWEGEWRDGKPYSEWQDLPPLQADPGVTALAGQVLDLKGKPLPNVTLEMDGIYGSGTKTSQTDNTGRFLLQDVQYGQRVFLINGTTANTPGKTYGIFKVGVEIIKDETNVLPYTIWMPRIDTAHAVTIPSPTAEEVVITTPKIPGLELHIPAGAVIKDHEGNTVTEIGITPIPLDRPPFPLPVIDVNPPAYFTIQPGGSYIYADHGARLIYPNYSTNPRPPGGRFDFWHYTPSHGGWYIYGQGSVTEDGAQIVPDPGVSIYEFTGAMVGGGPAPPDEEPDECKDGDPVDLCGGIFLLSNTDLSLPDVIPLEITRTYRTRDNVSRAFGVGSNHPYEIYLYSVNNYQDLDLILPDGSRIHYVRTSPGTGFTDAVYEHRAPDAACPTCVGSPGEFNGSVIAWNGQGWTLKRKDGSEYDFPESCTGCPSGAVNEIRDRYGNRVKISRAGTNSFGDPFGNITQITSPNGRWIQFTYDAGNRITQATDNIGRTVNYTYDANGRLTTVTDPEGGVTAYTYDTFDRMLTVTNPRGILVVSNEYDANGKVIKQTLANGGTYQFAYTEDANGNVIQTDVTDPRGIVRRVTFNATGAVLTDTRALGTPEEQTLTYERDTATELALSVTDALGRKTTNTFDALGNVATITRLAGTSEAVTTSFTYEPTFNKVAGITNPLGITTTFAYDNKGNLTRATDPLGNETTFTYNTAGQPVSITDPFGNTAQFIYDLGDLVSVVDPLGNTTNSFIDATGRLLSMRNPLDQLIRYDYDDLNRLLQVTDPQGGVTGFGYDSNGNLLSVTDARGSATSYAYDNMDRLDTRTDPLLRSESYQYDLAGNLTQFTDRNGQVTIFQYDALNRRTFAGFGAIGDPPVYESTISYTYDAGNRLTQITDSITGTITRTYDNLNRLTSETTPQGSVSYTYDAAGRRTSMTVNGQPTVFYAYDAANRLTQITQGTSTVSFAYDIAGRRTSLTLPNGILVEYAYDAASRVTAITYKLGTTVLGDLTYTYDAAGNRTKIGGSFARTGIPQAIASGNYNAANQQLALADKTMTYDNNGNLTSLTDANGTTDYTWNARNQLIGISGPSVNATFEYDPLGRRVNKTINSNITEFVYDGVNPVQETSGAAVLANILSGLGIDEFFTRTDAPAGTTSSLLTDALGSAIALADSAGAVQTEYTYEPFGGTTATGLSSTSFFQYTGRENDGSGLYYYRARYYHPGLQRFISEDPIGFAAGDANLYAYVFNNPINFLDPLGLICKTIEKGTYERETGITQTVRFVQWKPVPRLGLKIGVIYELIKQLIEVYLREQVLCFDDCTGKLTYESPILPRLIGKYWEKVSLRIVGKLYRSWPFDFGFDPRTLTE